LTRTAACAMPLLATGAAATPPPTRCGPRTWRIPCSPKRSCQVAGCRRAFAYGPSCCMLGPWLSCWMCAIKRGLPAHRTKACSPHHCTAGIRIRISTVQLNAARAQRIVSLLHSLVCAAGRRRAGAEARTPRVPEACAGGALVWLLGGGPLVPGNVGSSGRATDAWELSMCTSPQRVRQCDL
jgi:hypothetical protein